MTDDPDTDEDIIDVDLDVWAECDTDQRIRLFVLKHYSSSGDPPGIEGRIFIENMEAIFTWIKEGKVPAKPRERKANLNVVQ